MILVSDVVAPDGAITAPNLHQGPKHGQKLEKVLFHRSCSQIADEEEINKVHSGERDEEEMARELIHGTFVRVVRKGYLPKEINEQLCHGFRYQYLFAN